MAEDQRLPAGFVSARPGATVLLDLLIEVEPDLFVEAVFERAAPVRKWLTPGIRRESTTHVEGHQEPDPRPRFDPQAALEELERFGRDIQRYRKQREALGDQFETFVGSFKTPPAAAPPVTEAATTPGVPAAPVPAVPDTRDSAPPSAAPPQEVADAVSAAPPLPSAVSEPRVRAKSPAPAIAAGAALLLGGGILAAFLWSRSPEPVSEPAATSETAAPPTSAPSATATPAVAADTPATAEPAPPAAPGSGYEIVTDRRVWMRVIVDGARVVEREVPAGTRLPLKPEKSIVIRTGDAGAVRLSLRGGTPTPLGREGEVVTRSFTVPPPSASGVR
ncbi:MAG TPA: RodZ domain-containing protein [Vicinamibacterales bacterium]|nr:RodZ domain-containing protein [Vicinamibacterales bacterium]